MLCFTQQPKPRIDVQGKPFCLV